jgi:hypothetical protein
MECPHLGHAPRATDHCKTIPKLTKATHPGITPQSQGRGTCGIKIKMTAIPKVVMVPQVTPPKIRIAEVKGWSSRGTEASSLGFCFGASILLG